MQRENVQHLIVKFSDKVDVRLESKTLNVTLNHADATGQLSAICSVLKRIPDVQVRRTFNAVDSEKINALVKIAVARNARSRRSDDCATDKGFDRAAAAQRGVRPIITPRKYQPPKFDNYVSLHFPADKAGAETVLRQLKRVAHVDYAYVRVADKDAATTLVKHPDDTVPIDPMWLRQSYLRAAPDGIGAEQAWSIKGGDGANQSFVDIERGWDLEHEDLLDTNGAARVTFIDASSAGAAPPFVNVPDSRPHGTAVLGIVCASNNNRGMIGIAPNCDARVLSYWNTAVGDPVLGSADTANALLAAIADQLASQIDAVVKDETSADGQSLTSSVTVLVEAQAQLADQPMFYFPVEVYPETFHAIELATQAGVSIVEPAGNGRLVEYRGRPYAVNLDDYVNELPGSNGFGAPKRLVLNRDLANNAAFRDSGAIMVGAAEPVFGNDTVQWKRRAFSNYGSRIDCYAAGRDVATLGSWKQTPIGTSPNNQYCADFTGTSSAAAIIAGAAVALQGMYQAKNNAPPMSPLALRAALSDVTRGTRTRDHPASKIGVMPNLVAIANAL